MTDEGLRYKKGETRNFMKGLYTDLTYYTYVTNIGQENEFQKNVYG